MTCSRLSLAQYLLMTSYYNFFTSLEIYKFSLITSLSTLFYFTYLSYTTSLVLLYSHYFPHTYFTLITTLEVLCFSHSQSSEFTKINKLNRLAVLSLAQLSPSLFFSFFSLVENRPSLTPYPPLISGIFQIFKKILP